MKLLTIILLFPSLLCAQSSVKIHLNSRTAKDTSLFDYYSKLELTHTLKDSSWTYYLMGNYERDNGVIYYSYSGSITGKYLKLEYFKDTEIEADYTSLAFTYPVKIFRLGYNLLVDEEWNHAIYIRAKYKWLASELSFFDEVYLCKVNIKPQYEIKNNLKIGLGINYIFFDDQEKWEAGVNFEYKF